MSLARVRRPVRRPMAMLLAAALGLGLTACSDHTGTTPAVTRAAQTTDPGPAPATAVPTAIPSGSVTTTRTPGPATTTRAPIIPEPGRPQQVPPFRWHVTRTTKKSLGASWHAGCPVAPSSLRSVAVRFWGFDGTVHEGVIVLHKDVVRRARAVFATMYQRKFPVRSVIPVNQYPKASDDASMAADNTSAFNCRRAVASGPPSWSRHAYGKAIDVNPVENPCLFGRKVLPPAGKKYRNRAKPHPGMIRKGDRIYRKFIAAGFHWGGAFSDPDYQHFDR